MNQNLIGINEMAEKLDVPVSWFSSKTAQNRWQFQGTHSGVYYKKVGIK